MCIQQNRQKGNRYLDIWLPFTFRQRALSQNPTTAFENAFFKKQILGLKMLIFSRK